MVDKEKGHQQFWTECTSKKCISEILPPLHICHWSCPHHTWQAMPFIWGRRLECFNAVNAEVTEWLQELAECIHIHISLMTYCGSFSCTELSSQGPIRISRRNTLKRTKAKKWKAKRPLRSEPQVKLQILIFMNIKYSYEYEYKIWI